MAMNWDITDIVAEHRDLQVNTMAVDYFGRLALLAGRRTIAVVDLKEPHSAVSKVPRQSKWQIDAVQWNPHASHAHLFVTACNQRADVWSWENAHCKQLNSLKAHTRVISDLDWSPFDPNVITTCSVDTYTHLWDIRDLRKPKQSLQGIAGVSQVKWNKINSNLLATCHDGDIRIWDARKSNQPMQYIAGHLSKIHGLDWSPHVEDELATSSQDCWVKFWNINQPRLAVDKMCPSSSPVWRARYTPFGNGLVTVVVPQLRRGENSLLLWNREELNVAVHTFYGHSDVILEFQWRKIEDNSYQLVTWSKDQSLRLWHIEPMLLKHCGVDTDTAAVESCSTPIATEAQDMNHNDRSTARSASGKTGIEIAHTPPLSEAGIPRPQQVHSPQQPKSLQQEFLLVNFDVNNVKVTETDVIKRKCLVTAVSSNGHHMISLTMSFPDSYPSGTPPTFDLKEQSSISKTIESQITTALNTVAMQHVQYGRSCIEPCLRQLVTSLDNIQETDVSASDDDKSEQSYLLASSRPLLNHPLLFPPTSYQPYQDKTVPFPRTSGARFGGSGYLICFTRKAEQPRRSSSMADVTPRALGDLSTFGSARTPQRPAPTFSLFSSLGSSTTPPSGNSDILQKWFAYKDTQTQSTRKLQRPRSKSRSNHQRQDSFNLDRTSPRKKDKASRVGPVILYDIHCVLPINQTLAENYVLDTSDIGSMCSTNADLAGRVGRADLVQMWSMLSLIVLPALDPSPHPDHEPWAAHPFGRQTIKSLIDHFTSLNDVQSLAMLTCVISRKCETQKLAVVPVSRATSDYTLKPSHYSYNPYHTIHSTDIKGLSHISKSLSKRGQTGPDPASQAASDRQGVSKSMKRSNSLSDMNFEGLLPAAQAQESEEERHKKSIRLVDTFDNQLYDRFKRAYADILYRMNLLTQRAQVLKYVSVPTEPHTGIEFKTNCHYCQRETRGVQCFHSGCRKFAFQCVICHIAVRGSSTFCLACGHGGHASHMQQWFSTHDVCPSGCGCVCLTANPMVPQN